MAHRKLLGCLGDGAELRGPIMSPTGVYERFTLAQVHLCPVPGELDLVQPIGTIGRALPFRWVARLYEVRII
jgi:hypothetical protein